ncbi:MAG: hypothetical protein Q4G36_07535 [Paracoccus sp. (in: a-proteobacteria)]|nr:hypothetical protein [Paracoccus sp. (in: a-proteobacteria)]
MYEHLDTLTESSAQLLSSLKPLCAESIEAIRASFPECPSDYLAFIAERGAGEMEDGLMFFFRGGLVDAAADVFGDDEIYSKGAVKIFGDDGSETSYGFDTGANWHLVSVDSFRIVNHLPLTFGEFIEGLLICYPNYPVGFDGEGWRAATGERYLK